MPSTFVQEARISPAPMVNNLLINPGFDIWQRGTGPFTSPSGSGTNIWTADEWLIDDNVNDQTVVTRDTSAPLFGDACVKIERTFNGGASCNLQQGIEAYKSLEGQWLTGSIWAKTTREDAIDLRLGDYNGAWERENSSAHSGSGEWEQLVVTKKIRTGLQSYTSIPHLFGIMFFPTIHNVSADVYLDGAVLAAGYFPEGVPFVPPNPSEDLERCQRFYQTNDGNYRDTNMYRQDVITGQTLWANALKFRTKMYATPTLTLTNGGNSASFPAAVGTVNITQEGFREYRTTTATNTGQYFFSHWTAEVP